MYPWAMPKLVSHQGRPENAQMWFPPTLQQSLVHQIHNKANLNHLVPCSVQVCERWFWRLSEKARHKCMTKLTLPVECQHRSVQCRHCERWYQNQGGADALQQEDRMNTHEDGCILFVFSSEDCVTVVQQTIYIWRISIWIQKLEQAVAYGDHSHVFPFFFVGAVLLLQSGYLLPPYVCTLSFSSIELVVLQECGMEPVINSFNSIILLLSELIIFN